MQFLALQASELNVGASSPVIHGGAYFSAVCSKAGRMYFFDDKYM